MEGNTGCRSLEPKDLSAYKECFDNSPLAFCVIDVLKDSDGKVVDFAFVYLNKALADLEGKHMEDLWGKHFYQIFDNTDVKWLDFYGSVAYGGQSNTFDEFSPEINKCLHISCYQISNGRCGCLLTDITDKKEMEALLELQMKYSFAVSVADLSMWEYDIENNRVIIPHGRAGSIAIERYGLSGHEIDGFPNSIGRHSRIATNWRELTAAQKELASGKPVVSGEVWYRKDGEKTMRCDKVSYSVTCGADGRATRAYGVGCDITAFKKATQHYEKKLAKFLQSCSTAAFYCRLDLTKDLCMEAAGSSACFTDALASESAVGLLGKIAALAADEGEGRALSTVMEVMELIHRYEEGEDEVKYSLNLTMDDKTARRFNIMAELMLNPGSASVEAVCCITGAADEE